MAQRGKYGTAMTIVRRKRKKFARRRDYTRASAVKVTKADGSVEYQRPYGRGEHAHILSKR